MSLEEFSFVAEIVGVILVLLSLIYLAIQVQQNTRQLKIGSVTHAVHEFIHAFISAHGDENSANGNISTVPSASTIRY